MSLGSLGRPGQAGTRAVPIIFIAVATSRIRVDDQIHGKVVVFDTRDRGVFGAFGIDEPAVYESNVYTRGGRGHLSWQGRTWRRR